MADVAGFRAVGYVAAKAAPEKVLAFAEVESSAARERWLAADPHNVVRLLDPGAVGAGAQSPVAGWLAQGVLQQEPSRALYRVHQEYTLPELAGRTLIRRSVLCAVRIPSLVDGGVKTHKAVREREVAAHTAAILRHKLHAAPVVAAFRDPATEIDRLFRRVEAGPPSLQVRTPDGVTHRVWRCTDAEIIGQMRHLLKPRKLYLLEGHERFAAALAAGEELAAAAPMPMYAAGNYVLMSLVNLEDQALLSAPCHRLVSGPPIAQSEVLAKAARYFAVQKLTGLGASGDRVAREMDTWTSTQATFALAFPGSPDLWQLTLLPAVNPRDEGVEAHPAIARFDPFVVEELFFRKVLGAPALPFVMSEPVADKAAPAAAQGQSENAAAAPPSPPIAPAPTAGGAAGSGSPVTMVHDATTALAALAGKDPPWMAVLCRPVTMQQIVHVADIGQALPPSSTKFSPPALGGVAMLALTADEDLV